MSVTPEDAAPAPKGHTELRVDAGSTGEPLRSCVTAALRKYFETLDGHDCCNLYNVVLAQFEVPLLEAVLDYTGGNQTRAAKILGLSRGTLRKKLHLYELD